MSVMTKYPNNKMKDMNRLRRIVEIQNITLEHTRRGITQRWVFDNIIYPRFFISERAYYRYLAYPAKKELKEAEEQIKIKRPQPIKIKQPRL